MEVSLVWQSMITHSRKRYRIHQNYMYIYVDIRNCNIRSLGEHTKLTKYILNGLFILLLIHMPFFYSNNLTICMKVNSYILVCVLL
jgi:hypothetical protein